MRRKRLWYYSQWFSLYRPSPVAIAVATSFYGFKGGAHGYAEVQGTLVDLRSGRIAPTPMLFCPDADWLRAIGEVVRLDLRKQFGKRPGFENALTPDNVVDLARQHDRYIFKRDVLAIVFFSTKLPHTLQGSSSSTFPTRACVRSCVPTDLSADPRARSARLGSVGQTCSGSVAPGAASCRPNHSPRRRPVNQHAGQAEGLAGCQVVRAKISGKCERLT
jgi:hypothetical protein